MITSAYLTERIEKWVRATDEAVDRGLREQQGPELRSMIRVQAAWARSLAILLRELGRAGMQAAAPPAVPDGVEDVALTTHSDAENTLTSPQITAEEQAESAQPPQAQ